MKTINFLTALIFSFMFVTEAAAQWNSNPNVNATLCSASGNQRTPVAVSDQNGGIISAWIDTRTSPYEKIYVQRYNSAGVPQWQVNGVELSSTQLYASDLMAIPDGFGSMIICWKEQRPGSVAMYYTRKINGSGVPQWASETAATVPYSASNDDEFADITSDSFSGVVLVYKRYNNTISRFEIHAQNIAANGIRYWGANGVVVATTLISIDFNFPKACPDMTGGAVIAYERGSRIHAQRLNTNGVKQWGAEGFDIFGITNGGKIIPVICTDGSGGAIIACMDERSSGLNNFDIYAQRVSSAGTKPWGDAGKPVAALTERQWYHKIIYDRNYGAYISWDDERAGGDSSRTYLQRINPNGNPYFAVNGIKVSGTLGSSIGFTSIDSLFVQLVLANSYPNLLFFGQKYSNTGQALWGTEPVPVTTVVSQKYITQHSIVTDNSGGLVCVWDDSRNNPFVRIYGHKIQSSGTTGISFTNSIPDKFTLGQNYPNPFNPSTNITFSIPANNTGIVHLAVYDITGREVSVLVDEFKPAGIYTVEFNAQGLSSGAYFCRLSARNFTETKKMLLIK